LEFVESKKQSNETLSFLRCPCVLCNYWIKNFVNGIKKIVLNLLHLKVNLQLIFQ